jgi:hypothetical protein
MSSNLDQFGLYAATILNNLYDAFPIPNAIFIRDLINEYVEFETLRTLQHEESTVNGLSEILEMAGGMDESMKIKANEKHQRIKSQIRDERDKIEKQEEIVKGTIHFLASEGYIRNHGEERFQLSEKGFVHLHKEFQDSKIADTSGTLISIIKDKLSDPGKFGGALTSGVLINILTKVFGG